MTFFEFFYNESIKTFPVRKVEPIHPSNKSDNKKEEGKLNKNKDRAHDKFIPVAKRKPFLDITV